jgi:ribosomal protein S27AE
MGYWKLIKRILIGTNESWYCPQCDCLNMAGRWYCGNCGLIDIN